jgi:hypothetical protein
VFSNGTVARGRHPRQDPIPTGNGSSGGNVYNPAKKTANSSRYTRKRSDMGRKSVKYVPYGIEITERSPNNAHI